MSDPYDAPQDQPHGEPEPEPGHGAGAGEPEYLGAAAPRSGNGRRWAAVGAASVAVVAAAGVGAWGVAQLMSGGESAASAVPAGAVAYMSLDLDPSAGQKIEALTMLKKFPAIAEELDLDVRDDIRRWVFEQVQADGQCTEVDYAADVEPWLGDRMAVAAASGVGGKLKPLVVVQVADQDAATAGVAKLADCGGEEIASAFVGDYMLLSEEQLDVDVMAADAKVASLQDDAGYTEWMERAGDPGIMSAYVSADAPRAIADAAGSELGSAVIGPQEDRALKQVEKMYEDFEGMAMVVRFADGGFEAEMVAGGMPDGMVSGGGGLATVGTLPATTAAAMSVALPEGWLREYADAMASSMGGGMSSEDLWNELEGPSGLDLPEDIETLLGDGFTVSVDAGADLGKLMSSPDPTDVPVGVRISGDPAEITRVLDKLLALAGPEADFVVVEETDDGVTLGLSKDYVDVLVAGGDLGETESFQRVAPDVERASGVFYVDFDAGDGWAERLADAVSRGDAEVRANVEPLDAFGATSWLEDDATHALIRLTTD